MLDIRNRMMHGLCLFISFFFFFFKIYNVVICTTFHRYPIFSKRYSVLCKVYTGYCGTSEIEHGLCACTVDNPLAKARGLSLRTGAQTMLYLPLVPHSTKRGDYLSVQAHNPCSISHLYTYSLLVRIRLLFELTKLILNFFFSTFSECQ